MYPKWLAKLIVATNGFAEATGMKHAYVVREKNVYRVFGIADLHREKLLSLAMRMLCEFSAPFGVITSFSRDPEPVLTPEEKLRFRLEREGAVLVEEDRFSVASFGARRDILEEIGHDVTAWGKNRRIWDGMYMELFPRECFPNDPLSRWKAGNWEPELTLATELYHMPPGLPGQSRREPLFCALSVFCVSVKLPHGSSPRVAQGLEHWLATALSELDFSAEWYVTGKLPDCEERMFQREFL
ncbi:MAG: hypothetical protein IJC88_04840 [Oscillospiraceae bacterium]|nr:hypothetical protein [Oscillospiraceae bacterium]